MKTAVSIPDDVFRAAEATARRNRMSRSRLFTEALRMFLEVHGERGVTERLDQVYERASSNLDPVLARMQWASLPEDW